MPSNLVPRLPSLPFSFFLSVILFAISFIHIPGIPFFAALIAFWCVPASASEPPNLSLLYPPSIPSEAVSARSRPWLQEASVVVRPPHFVPSALPPTAWPGAHRAAAVIDVVLVKPAILKKAAGEPKAKPVKRVRFGEVSTVMVERWIVPSEHTHPEPGV
jgi:hypothetical protein